MNLRDEARDRPCMIRTPRCNGRTDTTVLCHARLIGISGMGLKAPDLLAAWGCSDCHAFCDSGREPLEVRQLYLLTGMARTQAQLIKEGLGSW